MFTFAICRRPSVCLSSVCLSVTFVHPTQPIEIFGNVSAPFKWLKIHEYFLRQKCRPNNVVFNDILLTAILAGDHPKR